MKAHQNNSESMYNDVYLDLIALCRKGDQKAQFSMYKLYYKAMYNTSLRIVKDPMEAEDIMQESFLTAFDKIGSYSGTVSFGAWLKRIVQNKSIDALRKAEKLKFSNIEELDDVQFSFNEFEDDNEVPEGNLRKVMDVVNRLPQKCSRIFSLYFLEGYDHEEISEILSIEECTSRSQLSRARQHVRRELRELSL